MVLLIVEIKYFNLVENEDFKEEWEVVVEGMVVFSGGEIVRDSLLGLMKMFLLELVTRGIAEEE